MWTPIKQLPLNFLDSDLFLYFSSHQDFTADCVVCRPVADRCAAGKGPYRGGEGCAFSWMEKVRVRG